MTNAAANEHGSQQFGMKFGCSARHVASFVGFDLGIDPFQHIMSIPIKPVSIIVHDEGIGVVVARRYFSLKIVTPPVPVPSVSGLSPR
jgi:hypothetical protein